MTTKPNIVFFFTDGQRFSAIDALGIEDVRTPNIDALATRGKKPETERSGR
ncbi:MAG: hypothetical protein V3S89_03160 [Desulfobacterales bacterium]